MPSATCLAFVFSAAVVTVPFNVITPLATSTLIVESRRSLVVARADLVLNHSQLSSRLWPNDSFEPLFFSYSLRFFSYSSLEMFEFHFEEFVLLLVTYMFELAVF